MISHPEAAEAGTVKAGRTYGLGPTLADGGVNFSLFSKDATQVELLLFDNAAASQPARVITLDPRDNRSSDYWHVFVPGIHSGQVYAYRIQGPHVPEKGLRFDPDKILLDPYAKGLIIPPTYSREAARRPGDNCAAAMKSVVADTSTYDWEDDAAPQIPFSRSVIYEMHVRGFTRHPNSGVQPSLRGTFAGAIEKIPYLQDLGITAIELLPVFAFDPQDAPPRLSNYWGYSPISFFALYSPYSSQPDSCAAIDEFRDMVKALHRAGIEVILDVVYNHTAEGGHDGPTLCFRGIANDFYYTLQENKALYADFTGCGNTFCTNGSVAKRLILDSLHYWVNEMHVDGFRFDLASVFSRDVDGQPAKFPSIISEIESDPILANTKLIAEAWDAAGLYQVGSFGNGKWKEWNGKFRDDIRGFARGDTGLTRTVAHRLLGSPDVYATPPGSAGRGINFVTCHDGFTLNDLVSYNSKHNEANLQDNHDGYNYNLSWNCGVEGPSTDSAIDGLRNRQIKNFLALTLLAAGTPMLLMGDEARRTQRGNNNAFCQDNEISWFDWSLLQQHSDIHRFMQRLIAFRLGREIKSDELDSCLIELLYRTPVQFHGVKLYTPDWGETSRSLAFSASSAGAKLMLYFAYNSYWDPLPFEIPPLNTAQGWRRWIDTYLDCPNDIAAAEDAPAVNTSSYLVQPRSIVTLLAQTEDDFRRNLRQ